jgi:hypothetical protein
VVPRRVLLADILQTSKCAGAHLYPAANRVVVYKGPGEVAVGDIEYPKLEVPGEVADAMGMSEEASHAAILKIVSTNVCSQRAATG